MARTTVNDYEQIMLRRAYGMGNNAIAKDLGLAPNIVSGVLNTFDAVKNSNWDRCCELITKWRVSIELVKWAASKTGVELPETVISSYNDRLIADRAKKANKTPAEPAPDRITAENERIFTLKMLEYMAKTNELLEQLMDVVMPKYCGDLKDNVNANCDIICERLKNCEDKLEAIKANTRKRGL